MKREFLSGLGLTDKDIIDKIMAENGQDIEAARTSESSKFSAERDTLTARTTELQGQLDARDADIQNLQTQLTTAQNDAGQLTAVTQSLSDLQARYDTERQEWSQKQAQQAYEFAIKQKAGELKFTSAAAKKDFVREAIAAGLKMDGDTILGYNDFVDKYKTADPQAFVVDTPPADPGDSTPPPEIVLPKGGESGNTGNSAFGFNFHGVRPMPKE